MSRAPTTAARGAARVRRHGERKLQRDGRDESGGDMPDHLQRTARRIGDRLQFRHQESPQKTLLVRNGNGLVGAAHFLDRIHQHALRSAERPDGAKTAIANPVVHGAPRNAQQLCGLLDAHAATDLRLKIRLAVRSQGLKIH